MPSWAYPTAMARWPYNHPLHKAARARIRGRMCEICGIRKATVADHIVPVSAWPAGTPVEVVCSPDNYRPSCRECSDAQGRRIAAANRAKRRPTRDPRY